MKSLFLLPCFSFLFLVSCFSVQAEQLTTELSAPSAILVNSSSGVVLFEKHAYEQGYPASITKIATALYTLHLGKNLDELVTAKQEAIASISPQAKKQSNYRSPAYWLESDGTHMGIKKGEMISLKDLLYGMMLVSANDAANVIAQHVSGTIPQFMQDVNAYLKQIGCKQTHFCNPHGLHHPDHVSTPYDMSIITREAMRYPLFREIVATTKYICPETNLQEARTFTTGNHLIRSGQNHYSKAIGVKTGYHSAAGKTLVAAAKEADRELIAVVFNCATRDDRYIDATKLFKLAFDQPKVQRKLLSQGIQKIELSASQLRKKVKTCLAEDLIWNYYPSEEEPIKLKVKKEDLSAAIVKGQIVGQIQVINAADQILKQVDLLAFEDVNCTVIFKLKQWLSNSSLKWPIVIIAGMSIILVMRLFRKKRRVRVIAD